MNYINYINFRYQLRGENYSSTVIRKFIAHSIQLTKQSHI